MVEFSIQQIDAHTRQLSLSGSLTIYHAAECKPRLLEALHDCRALELDLSAVEEMDSAGFQLLLLLKRECEFQQCSLSIIQHSTAVQEVIMFYNMDKDLGLSVVLPAQPH